MVDRSRAPSLLDAQRWRESEGATVCGVYLPGPCAVADQPTWTHDVVRWLLETGWGLIFIYPGPQRGCHSDLLSADMAPVLAEEITESLTSLLPDLPITTPVPVAIDVEAITSEFAPVRAREYAVALADELFRRGYYPGVYGVASFLRTLEPRSPMWVWVASWVRSDWDDSLDLAHIPGFPDELWAYDNQRIWQFASVVDRWLDLNYGNVEPCRLKEEQTGSGVREKLQTIITLAQEALDELI
ncbi:MAG: DUF1906 domain-containing protein [Candidatus Caldarchaeum sp.]